MFSKLALLGLLGSAAAILPNMTEYRVHEFTDADLVDVIEAESDFSVQSFDCGSPVWGLSQADCQHMSNIGMAGQGDNAGGNNGRVWIGTDGPNKFTFYNRVNVPATVIVWDINGADDYQASFMNVRRPKVSWTLPGYGSGVTVSIANGISGGWAALYDHKTILSPYGQIWNTWGEYTTGDYATVDVSRLVHRAGNAMSIRVANNGCVSDFSRCAFQCKNGLDTCWESGTYELINCAAGSQPGASYGTWDGINPEGGCQGFSWGGNVDIDLYD